MTRFVRIMISFLSVMGAMVACASPTRGNLGATHSKYAQGAKPPTAADYVQDGLIAMWDGIENAGWGVHDETATVWKDLVGDNDLVISGRVYEKAVEARERVTAAYRGGAIVDIGHVEICSDGTQSPYGILFVSGPTDANRIGVIAYPSRSAIQTYSNVFWDYPNISHSEGRTISASSGVCYVNGNSLPISSYPTDQWNNGDTVGIGGRNASGYVSPGNYYCVRCYSRPLTFAEIAHNYKIDKARFNLP